MILWIDSSCILCCMCNFVFFIFRQTKYVKVCLMNAKAGNIYNILCAYIDAYFCYYYFDYII